MTNHLENAILQVNKVFAAYESNFPKLTEDDLTFGGSQERKDAAYALAKAHQTADLVVQGQYWIPEPSSEAGYDREHVGGCAVGCLSHARLESGHDLFPGLYGIPESIAHQADDLFENLTQEAARSFPADFIDAIPVGADLSEVITKLRVKAVGDYLAAHPDAPELLVAALKKFAVDGHYIDSDNYVIRTMSYGDVSDLYAWKFLHDSESVNWLSRNVEAGMYALPLFLQALRDAPVKK
jgi:hypothetical protein